MFIKVGAMGFHCQGNTWPRGAALATPLQSIRHLVVCRLETNMKFTEVQITTWDKLKLKGIARRLAWV